MRDIKFRGRRVDNGEWIHGSLVNNLFFYTDKKPVYYIIDTGALENYDCWVDVAEIMEDFEVENVGQYTGLKDKYGSEIYEGDIVLCSRGCPHEVVWCNGYGGTFGGGMPTWYLSGIKEGYAWAGSEEIIGNIYENPDLLEKESE